MNTEEQFEQLKNLLALKRHEQPPPGYFDRLPRQIISRIEREEARRKVWSWRVWAALQEQPAFAAAFGVAVCALLVAGIFFTTNTGQSGGLKMNVAASPDAGKAQVGNSNTTLPATTAPQLAGATASSTNPVLSSKAPDFLFNSSLLRSSGVPVSVPAPQR